MLTHNEILNGDAHLNLLAEGIRQRVHADLEKEVVDLIKARTGPLVRAAARELSIKIAKDMDVANQRIQLVVNVDTAKEGA